MDHISLFVFFAMLLIGFSFPVLFCAFKRKDTAKNIVVRRGLSVIALAAILLPSITFVVSADSADIPSDTISEDEEADVDAPASGNFNLDAKSAILMEATTGKILYEMNAEEALPPASVTKIMTLLLVMEALDKGNIALSDRVTVSAYAASMGGSQVFLEEGEEMSLEDLLKCTVIASANDAAVALAEHLMGSEEAFVARMNERATELGLSGAHFENVTGLDDDTTNHMMSAKDIAVISAELISHKKVLEYSSVWMDTIRDGAFTLTNTNRLIRYYDGATGLKTGSTEKAKFCITATAERNGMSLIAVIMAAPSRDVRNACAKTLFDWGFANYGIYEDAASICEDVPVLHGVRDSVSSKSNAFKVVLPKDQLNRVERTVSMSKNQQAPIQEGNVIGTVSYMIDGVVIGCADVCAQDSIPRLNYWTFLGRMIKIFVLS